MDLLKETARGRGSVADFRRDLIRKITDKTVAELAQEMGISPADLRRWSKMVKRTENTAATFERTLVPARRAHEPEGDMEELRRLLGKQAVVLQIEQKKKETV